MLDESGYNGIMDRKSVFILLGMSFLAGCHPKVPVKPPVVQVPVTTSPIVGTWENNVRGVNRGRMIFKANGELTFQNGLEFYNPGHWEWDPMRKQLFITQPQAPDRKLDIFKMYVGDGVQSFDRAQKRITYRFDDQTTSLNVAGWTYMKIDTTKPQILEEPTLH